MCACLCLVRTALISQEPVSAGEELVPHSVLKDHKVQPAGFAPQNVLLCSLFSSPKMTHCSHLPSLVLIFIKQNDLEKCCLGVRHDFGEMAYLSIE